MLALLQGAERLLLEASSCGKRAYVITRQLFRLFNLACFAFMPAIPDMEEELPGWAVKPMLESGMARKNVLPSAPERKRHCLATGARGRGRSACNTAGCLHSVGVVRKFLQVVVLFWAVKQGSNTSVSWPGEGQRSILNVSMYLGSMDHEEHDLRCSRVVWSSMMACTTSCCSKPQVIHSGHTSYMLTASKYL